MNYAQQQRDPTRHLIGISVVVVFHIILAYALANGLAKKIVKFVEDPLDVKLIEEFKPPPPPPPKIVQPKIAPPPPVYVPPPEVVVNTPPPPPEVVVATVAVPPPPAPPVEVAPPPPPPPVAKPAVASVGVACPNHQEIRSNTEYPAQAQRLNLSGNVVVEFTVDANGSIKNVNVLKSSNKVFNNAATNAVAKFQCVGQGQEVHVRVPFEFKSEG
ncbi:MAG: energy transducer TonB [Methylophilaceae bacterium]|nr:energy transducer TonB [Methylophilaceae bacterium]